MKKAIFILVLILTGCTVVYVPEQDHRYYEPTIFYDPYPVFVHIRPIYKKPFVYRHHNYIYREPIKRDNRNFGPRRDINRTTNRKNR